MIYQNSLTTLSTKLNRIIAITLLIIPSYGISTAKSNNEGQNFIQILTDDQGWGDLGSFGHQYIQTPNIDKLAKEGIKFTNCYSAHGVCSPSRAAILTGRTPYRNGVYRWIPANHYCHLPASEVTLPQLLLKNGYQTAHFGKWHLSHYSEKKINKSGGYTDFKYGQDTNQPGMTDYGYQYWFATGNVARPDHKNPQNFFLNGKAMGELEGFSAHIVAEQFVKWMDEHRKKEAPVFVTVWFHEPHGPVNSDPRLVEKYSKLNDSSLQQYFANVSQIDEAVGTIVNSLKEAGIYSNTLIWYTSDNGPEGKNEFGTFNKTDSPFDKSRYRGSNGGLKGRKRFTHEGGIRVPGIITWPAGFEKYGVKPGNISAEPIIGSDVFPTVLELAGIEPPQDVVIDGTSILPLLQNKEFKRERPLYWRNNRYEFRIALRDGDWKIVGNSERTIFELYNLAWDIRETTDLSQHYPELFEKMKKALIEYDKEVLDEGPDWWKNDKRVSGLIPTE